MNIDRYIEKWLKGDLSQEEMTRFKQTKSYREMRKISDSMEHFKAPSFDVEKELDRFNQIKSQKGKVIGINWERTLIRIAAMLTIVIGSYLYYIYLQPTTLETNFAEKTKLLLPDSSEVILNSVSRITYNEKRWKKDRKIELEGEAFFRVRNGSEFKVETSSGIVSVIGTHFNVKDRPSYFEVICYEGLVEVETYEEINQLPAKHSIRFLNGMISKDTFSTEIEAAWLNNESSFRSVPYIHVLKEFERQFDIKIITENVNTKKLFTGRFSHVDMILALKSITIPQNISYQIIEDRRVILSGEIE